MSCTTPPDATRDTDRVDSGTDTGCDAAPVVSPHLQDALDAACPGATIEVPGGDFDGNLEITKPVTLRGAGSALTTIHGFGDGSVVIVWKEACDVRLEGLTITSGSGGTCWPDYECVHAGGGLTAGALTTLADVVLTDNYAHDAGGAIYVAPVSYSYAVCANGRGADLVAEHDVVIEENMAPSAAAIMADEGHLDPTGATVRDNHDTGPGSAAIFLRRSDLTLGPGGSVVDNDGGVCGGVTAASSFLDVDGGTIAGNTGSAADGACLYESDTGRSHLTSKDADWGDAEAIDILLGFDYGGTTYAFGTDATFTCDTDDDVCG